MAQPPSQARRARQSLPRFWLTAEWDLQAVAGIYTQRERLGSREVWGSTQTLSQGVKQKSSNSPSAGSDLKKTDLPT